MGTPLLPFSAAYKMATKPKDPTIAAYNTLMQELRTQMDRLLNSDDRDFLHYSMKEYSTHRSVGKLIMSLTSCLDTSEKKNLLPHIRNIIPKTDVNKFDALAPYSDMSNSFNPPWRNGRVSGPVRSLLVHKQGGTLGFSIRGGIEHGLGIFVSKVDAGSSAERGGLQVGDQIITANSVCLHGVTHPTVVGIFKCFESVKLEVLSKGRITKNNNAIVWVDAVSNSVMEGSEGPAEDSLEETSEQSQLLSFADQHKVILRSTPGKSLGFSIRGGKEFDLGIYVSSVMKDSVANGCGMKVGDQVLDVNGHSFRSILHAEAVSILKAYPTLMVTVKVLGKLPKLPSELGPSPPGRRRSGPNLLDEDHMGGESGRGRHPTAPPTTGQHDGHHRNGYHKPAAAGESRSPSFARSKSPPRTLSTSSRAQSPPSSPRAKSPIRSRSRSNSGSSPPPSPGLGQYGRGMPRSKSPPPPARGGSLSRQSRGVSSSSEAAGMFRSAPSTTTAVDPQVETPRSTRSTLEPLDSSGSSSIGAEGGFDRSEPLRRSQSMKSPPVPISTITEEEEREEMEEEDDDRGRDAFLSTPVPQLKEFQRAHSYSGRGHKARTPIPLRPSPLLVSETANGFRTPSPMSSPVMKPFSPLHGELRSNSSPSVLEADDLADLRMFSQGMGSQVMHVTVSSPAKEMLCEEAKKYLDSDKMAHMKDRLQLYEEGTLSIRQLTSFILGVLDTPEKLKLLREMRSVLKAADLVKFDTLVCHREAELVQPQLRGSPKRRHKDPLLSQLQGGVNLKPAQVTSKRNSDPELGLFKDSAAHNLVDKAMASKMEVDDFTFRRRESYLAWKDVGGTDGSVLVEMDKCNDLLGLVVREGEHGNRRHIIVHSVTPGSAADLDGFIQPGFELLKVDAVPLKGRSEQEVNSVLLSCYTSDRNTIKILVNPLREL